MSAIHEIAKATETARVLLAAGADEGKVLASFFARVEALMSDNSTITDQPSVGLGAEKTTP